MILSTPHLKYFPKKNSQDKLLIFLLNRRKFFQILSLPQNADDAPWIPLDKCVAILFVPNPMAAPTMSAPILCRLYC